jgi:hypothetical protein
MARHLINAGHHVVLSNARGPETLRGLIDELGPQAKAGVKEEAVQSDLVILCVNWRRAQAARPGRSRFTSRRWSAARSRRAAFGLELHLKRRLR